MDTIFKLTESAKILRESLNLLSVRVNADNFPLASPIPESDFEALFLAIQEQRDILELIEDELHSAMDRQESFWE